MFILLRLKFIEKVKKKAIARAGLEPAILETLVRCSTNWAIGGSKARSSELDDHWFPDFTYDGIDTRRYDWDYNNFIYYLYNIATWNVFKYYRKIINTMWAIISHWSATGFPVI